MLIKPLVFLSLLAFVMSLTAVLFAYYSKDVIDSMLASSDRIMLYGAILILILVIQLISSATSNYYKAWFSNHLYFKIQQDYFSRLIRSVETFDKNHSAEKIHLFKKDLSIIAEGLSDILPKFIFYIFRFTGAFVVLYFLNPSFAILFFLVGALLLFASRLIRKPIFRTHKKAIEAESKMYAYMQDGLSQLEVIKAYEAESLSLNHLYGLNLDLIEKDMNKQKLSIFTNSGLQLFFSFGLAFSILVGAYQVSQDLLSVGELTAVIQLVSNIQSPFSGLSHLIPRYYSMQASIERLDALNNLKQEKESRYEIKPFETIEFKDVSFSYPDKVIFKDFNLTLLNHQKYVIKGKSGLGKTTLLKLLLGLLQTGRGTITLKGQSEIEISEQTRPYMAYVPQTPYFFSDTILNNLTFNHDVEDSLIMDALEKAHIYDDIMALKDKLETKLGESGVGLSIGQLQRLSLARALIKGSPILILDEITASLDKETEIKIIETLRELNDKTIIFISHKSSNLEGFIDIDL